MHISNRLPSRPSANCDVQHDQHTCQVRFLSKPEIPDKHQKHSCLAQDCCVPFATSRFASAKLQIMPEAYFLHTSSGLMVQAGKADNS